MQNGLVHIYTGAGKGKTTAAIGLGVRAYGQGFKVLMVQFLKGWATGEMNVIASFGPSFQLFKKQVKDKFTWDMSEEEMAGIKGEIRISLNHTIKAIMNEEWDMVIMDEIMAAVHCEFVSLEEVVELVRNKPLIWNSF